MNSPADITSDDIEAWAGKVSSPSELPVLVRRLVLATSDVQEIDFPGDGGTRLGGWDGRATVASNGPFSPKGTSGWELTVEKTKAKFDRDFEKRAAAHVAEPAGQPGSYVAVSARRYGSKAKWAAERAKVGPWTDVRLLDADDLATWLSTAPAVHAWFSRKLGRPVGEFVDVDEFRRRWSSRTSPALPSSLVLAGEDRQRAAESLRDWWRGNATGVLYVHADTVEEATLFVAEVINGPGMEQASARTLILESPGAWTWAATAQSSTTVLEN